MCLLALSGTAPLLGQSAIEHADSVRNSGDFSRAVNILRQHLRRVPGDTRAEAMLAETLYWQGDFTAALRHFEQVLAADPMHVTARRAVYEIRAASAAWVHVQAEQQTDNQPLDRIGASLTAGFFMTPLWSLSGRVAPARHESGALHFELLRAEAAVSGYLPAARLQVNLMAGSAEEFVGRAGLTLRPGGGVAFGGGVERDLYTHTIASLTERVMVTVPHVEATLDRAGWLGEAGGRLDVYPDDNQMTTLYLWLLAPLLRSSNTLLQAGYAGSWQDAERSRFAAGGQYRPYFTPEQEQQHGVAASLVIWSAAGARLQVNGSYGVHARRDVPSVLAGPGPRDPISFTTQSFHPYDVRLAGTLPVANRWTIGAAAQRMRTAFYRSTTIRAHITYRLVPRPIS